MSRHVIELSTLSPAEGFVIQGFPGYLSGGPNGSGAGDIDGDGFSDLIIRAPQSDEYRGAACVVFGAADGIAELVDGQAVLDLSALTPSQGFVIRGAADGDDAGATVTGAGDINGDGFDDLLIGSEGDGGGTFVLFGGNFTDAVAKMGGEGDDALGSGAAGQTIFGAQGDDTLVGRAEDDSLNGGADDDTLAGGNGDDRLVGDRGHDRATGGDGNDTLSGWAGNDTLSGEANEDSLHGNAGNDSLDGDQGRDTIMGGDGDDTLVGGGQSDVLVGSAGADPLTGGGDADRFVFAPGTSSADDRAHFFFRSLPARPATVLCAAA